MVHPPPHPRINRPPFPWRPPPSRGEDSLGSQRISLTWLREKGVEKGVEQGRDGVRRWEVLGSYPEGRGEDTASSRERYVRGHEEDGAPGGQAERPRGEKGTGLSKGLRQKEAVEGGDTKKPGSQKRWRGRGREKKTHLFPGRLRGEVQAATRAPSYPFFTATRQILPRSEAPPPPLITTDLLLLSRRRRRSDSRN